MSKPVRLVLLRTGEAPDGVRAEHGGFADWFRRHLQTADAVVEVDDLDMTLHDEHDPLDDLAGYDGVVMSGSAAMVGEDRGWMRRAVKTVQVLLEAETPFLGVCFGHQILGLAIGADVGPNPHGREMGSVQVQRQRHDDPLFSDLGDRLWANVSHADVIRDAKGKVEVIAEAPHDPFHVVRAGPVAWGVQYHPEFDAGVMRAYLHARRQTLDGERGHGTTDERLNDLRETPSSHSTLSTFAELVANRRRR